jgi:hypothetical protein
MDVSQIFIASSGKALVLAEQLREQLNVADYCKAKLWADVSKDKESDTIIEMLEGACKEYDFGVIILSQDDVMVKEKGDTLKARDNCVFEAGLFMAAIGRKRCFLVNSVKQTDLPSDLAGIISIPFKEPQDFRDPSECKDKITSASTQIKNIIYKTGPIKDRPLSRESLLKREKKMNEDGELYEDQVVVASIQPPFDLDFETAQQIRHNIDGNIRYIYFFPGSTDTAQKIPLLLQLLLLASILDIDKAEARNYAKRLDKVKNNRDQILKDLRQICNNGSLKIYFRPTFPDLQYCIHNATNDKKAKMYVKHKEVFIEWEDGKDAYDFWTEARKKQGAEYPEPPKAVFHGTPGFNVKEGTFYTMLKREMGTYFPSMDEEIMKFCLDGPQDEKKN